MSTQTCSAVQISCRDSTSDFTFYLSIQTGLSSRAVLVTYTYWANKRLTQPQDCSRLLGDFSLLQVFAFQVRVHSPASWSYSLAPKPALLENVLWEAYWTTKMAASSIYSLRKRLPHVQLLEVDI